VQKAQEITFRRHDRAGAQGDRLHAHRRKMGEKQPDDLMMEVAIATQPPTSTSAAPA